MHKTALRNLEQFGATWRGAVGGDVNPNTFDCVVASPTATGAETMARLLYGDRVIPFLSNFPERQGVQVSETLHIQRHTQRCGMGRPCMCDLTVTAVVRRR